MLVARCKRHIENFSNTLIHLLQVVSQCSSEPFSFDLVRCHFSKQLRISFCVFSSARRIVVSAGEIFPACTSFIAWFRLTPILCSSRYSSPLTGDDLITGNLQLKALWLIQLAGVTADAWA